MGFTRQIVLKTASLLRRHLSQSFIVAFIGLICWLTLYSSLQAECGDDVILSGEIPAHLRAQHAAAKELMSHQNPRESNDKNRLVSLFSPQAPQPFHGPNCGQGRSPVMATTIVPIPTDNQIHLYCTSEAALAHKDRAGRHSLVSEALLTSDHQQRFDRPPRV